MVTSSLCWLAAAAVVVRAAGNLGVAGGPPSPAPGVVRAGWWFEGAEAHAAEAVRRP